MNSTYVYLIQRERHDLFKIGISSDPHTRLKELQVGSPDKLSIYRVAKFDKRGHAQSVEKFFHNWLDLNNIIGEWFEITPDGINHVWEHVQSSLKGLGVNIPPLEIVESENAKKNRSDIYSMRWSRSPSPAESSARDKIDEWKRQGIVRQMVISAINSFSGDEPITESTIIADRLDGLSEQMQEINLRLDSIGSYRMGNTLYDDTEESEEVNPILRDSLFSLLGN